MLKEILDKTSNYFKSKGIVSARLDAELILGHALGMNRVGLYLNFDKPLSEIELEKCRELVRRRASGEPTAYILGYRDFYKSRFIVGPGVLIPRPETEMMVEVTECWLGKAETKNPKIVDLGSGSGCIAISVALENQKCEVVAVEASPEALEYLNQNAQSAKTSHLRVVGETVEQFSQNPLWLNHFDVVLSNPPYIAEDDKEVEANVRKYEPAKALFATDQGLGCIRSWAEVATKIAKPNAMIMFEIGSKQASDAIQIFKDLHVFDDIEIVKDHSGLDRFIKATRRQD